MGGQLDKRMLHWQPAKCSILQLFIIICYLANKVLLLLLLLYDATEIIIDLIIMPCDRRFILLSTSSLNINRF